jgi:hypothetical protein
MSPGLVDRPGHMQSAFRAGHPGAPKRVELHTLGTPSRLAALLIAHLCPISSLFAPCQSGAALRNALHL